MQIIYFMLLLLINIANYYYNYEKFSNHSYGEILEDIDRRLHVFLSDLIKSNIIKIPKTFWLLKNERGHAESLIYWKR